MTIPNVTMRWCTKQFICKWCDQPIDKGTPVVTVFFWNKGNENSRKWNTRLGFHPQCWIDQGLDYLKRNPYVTTYKGRRSLLPEKDRRKRFLLIRRFNALVQKRKNCNHGYPEHVILDIRLTQQMVAIMLDTAIVGGVPKGWVEKLQ